MNFQQKLSQISQKNNSLVCVGLDIDRDEMPQFLFDSHHDPYVEFTTTIIDATKDVVCAYKLNMAFYEALGKPGLDVLEKTIEHIPKNIIVILDGKRNDIGNTARKYAISMFDVFHADAVTLNPYLGKDGIIPFLEYKEKYSFILCRTSNPSAVDVQDLSIDKIPLYQKIAEKIKEWNMYGNCGAVVGATYPDELKKIRRILGDETVILIPGIGKQGGDLEKAVTYGTNKHGEMALINSSRGIIFAGKEQNYAEHVRKATMSLRNMINTYR